MTSRHLFLLCLLSACLQLLSAQTVRLDLRSGAGCRFDGTAGDAGPVYAFGSSREAEKAVEDILRQVGLPQNFRIRAANVPNAEAHFSGGERYILYSQQFMDDIQHRTGDYWSKIAVLAHEIGHHLLGHTLQDDGSRPLRELDADRWSGFVLYRLGASLAQAQLAARALTAEQGSATHPPRSARLEAIAVGYQEARELEAERAAASGDAAFTLGGRTWPVIRLAGLTWLAQDLDYPTEGSWCFDNNPANCRKYGRLYTWEAARQACAAAGWRLPTREEWRALAMAHGGFRGAEGETGDPEKANGALKKGGSSGFNATLGGERLADGEFTGDNAFGYYWSATEGADRKIWVIAFTHPWLKSLLHGNSERTTALSCRCVRG